jgi:late competence protein required for DNA uptake (superfamily II DNA/RNA helicase)
MIADAVRIMWIRPREIIQMNSINRTYMDVKCERCGSESRLMTSSIRSNSLICPVCLSNEIDCRMIKPEMRIHRDTDNTIHSVCYCLSSPVKLCIN